MRKGNVGYAKSQFVLDNVNKLSIFWFKEVRKMMMGEDKEDRRFALAQLRPLIEKTMPTEINAGETGLVIKLMHFGNNDSLSVDAGTSSTTNPTEQGEIQSGSDAQESPQDDLSHQ